MTSYFSELVVLVGGFFVSHYKGTMERKGILQIEYDQQIMGSED